MPDRYKRMLVPGYVRVELVVDEELLRWADAYTREIGASVDAVFEAALRQYRASRGEAAGEEG
jgi:hypothetical protein